MSNHTCRHCSTKLEAPILDLGLQPPSNSYLTFKELSQEEALYPLKVFVCQNCWLVQIPEYASAYDLFCAEYAYFSSTSTSWCTHAKNFVHTAIQRCGLDTTSSVVEIASNDGYLLQYVVENDIPCLGIEPTEATAQAAIAKGIPTLQEFFGTELATELIEDGNLVEKGCDLLIGNNVLAHVPDINDFMKGIQILLKAEGVASLEFPHLANLIKYNQFDTVYHEHYSYLSLHSVIKIASSVGLRVFDVEEIPTHGGSLRVWLAKSDSFSTSTNVQKVLSEEQDMGLLSVKAYTSLQLNAERIKRDVLDHLTKCKDERISVQGYGAAAKGNTLLNFAGIGPDLLSSVADQAPSKQGKYLPGSHIPIIHPEQLDSDHLFVLPWNLIAEIQQQYPSKILFTAIPNLKHYYP